MCNTREVGPTEPSLQNVEPITNHRRSPIQCLRTDYRSPVIQHCCALFYSFQSIHVAL